MSKKLPNTCYFCGKIATSREHVPPKSFFPKDKRKNLISVPSCKDHNNAFSKIDERFRFFLQATADSNIARQCFEKETLRGLNRKNRPGLQASLISMATPAILNGKDTLAFKVSRSEFEVFFEKIFKALFFKHTESVFSGQIQASCSHLTFPGENIRGMISLCKCFESNLTSIHVGEPSVFRYKIAPVIESVGKGFLLGLTFYDDITVFGLGIEERTGQQGEVVNSEQGCRATFLDYSSRSKKLP